MIFLCGWMALLLFAQDKEDCWMFGRRGFRYYRTGRVLVDNADDDNDKSLFIILIIITSVALLLYHEFLYCCNEFHYRTILTWEW